MGVGSSQKGFWLELKGDLARAKFRVHFESLLKKIGPNERFWLK